MARITLSIVVFLLSMSGFAQTLERATVSVIGPVVHSDDISISQTVGQQVAGPVSGGSFSLTQGFQQPVEISPSPAPKPSGFQATLYPNPANSQATVSITTDEAEILTIEVLDPLGAVAFRLELLNQPAGLPTHYMIPMHTLSQGWYFLRISNAQGVTRSHQKLVKT